MYRNPPVELQAGHRCGIQPRDTAGVIPEQAPLYQLTGKSVTVMGSRRGSRLTLVDDPIQYMVGPYVHVMALSLSRNLVRLTSCAANDGHIFSVKLLHTYQHPRPTTGPLCESNRIHEQFLQVGALPVHPYDHPAAKQPSIGQMNRKVYQLEAIDVVASSE